MESRNNGIIDQMHIVRDETIEQCKTHMTKQTIEKGEYDPSSLIQDLKNMCSAYRKDYAIFSNTHDNVAEKYLSVLDDLIKLPVSPACRYESAKCLVIALQEILTKENSEKFQKHLNFVYKNYPEIITDSKLLRETYNEEIDYVKDHLVSGRTSTMYVADEMAPFHEKYRTFHKLNEESILAPRLSFSL